MRTFHVSKKENETTVVYNVHSLSVKDVYGTELLELTWIGGKSDGWRRPARIESSVSVNVRPQPLKTGRMRAC